MSRKWLFFEKIFAVIEIVTAGLLGYARYQALLEVGETIADQAHPHLHLYQILANLNIIVLLFLLLAGGVLLLFNKKAGWLLSVPISFSIVCVMIIVTLAEVKLKGYDWLQFILCALIGIFVIVTIIQKPFLKKYTIVKRDWLIVLCLIIFIVTGLFWRHIF